MTDIERPGGIGTVDGLEDIAASDLIMPVFKMDHDNFKWVDSLTNQSHDSLSVIMLGVLKQRILWPEDPGAAGDTPICRAYTLETGYPDQEKFTRKLVLTSSGFSAADVEKGTLPCASCNLKEWGMHPKGNGPWCNEQYTTPVLVLDEEGHTMPAIISHQRTALKPLKAWITAFQGRQKPFYTAVTSIGIVAQSKGTQEYAVPKFTLVQDSDPAMWPDYSQRWHEIKTFLMTPRTRHGDDEPETPRTSNAAAPPAPAPAPPAPAPAPAPAQTVADSVAAPATKRAAPAKAATPAARPAAEEDEVPF